MTETEKEREDGVLGISFFFEREVGQDREDWLPHPKGNSKRRLVLSSFNSQDLVSISLYCLPYSSCDVSSKNLVLDQLIIS